MEPQSSTILGGVAGGEKDKPFYPAATQTAETTLYAFHMDPDKSVVYISPHSQTMLRMIDIGVVRAAAGDNPYLPTMSMRKMMPREVEITIATEKKRKRKRY